MKRIVLLLMILAAIANPWTGLRAQEKIDSTSKNDTAASSKKVKVKPPLLEPYHRNTIKFNPTPMLIQAFETRNITFSYERLINKNMSVVLQAGYLVFPPIFDDTIAMVIHMTRGNKKGINLASEYRWYPFARNRRPAPDGVYIGGYVQYYGYKWDNSFNIIHDTLREPGKLEGRLNILNVGFELGYQFIFWKRFSLDLLLFGPSFGYYQGQVDIKSTLLSPDEIQNVDEELVNKLIDRFPILNEVFSGEDLQFTGSKTTFKTGFRYCFQLGFHF
jgi:hypothetical protein